MALYRNMPFVVEAWQVADSDFTGDHPNENHVAGVKYLPQAKLAVLTGPQGNEVVCQPGDWIVRYADKTLTRMTHDFFQRQFVPANENTFDQKLIELARLKELLTTLPAPTPGVAWDTAYINWWYAWRRSETAQAPEPAT